jgi:integrase
MPRKKLSAVSIPTLSRGDWHDVVVPGLILRIGAKRRTWTYRASAGGRKLRVPLGYHPVMGLAEAREAARKASERIDSGVVPASRAPHPRSPDALTLGGLFDRYEALRTREGKRTKTLPEAMRLIRRALQPYLSLPAAQFSKADLRAARDAMVKADAMIAGNRLLQRLGPVLRWAAQEDLIPVNFTPDIRKAPEQKRTRKLTDAEIKAIWKACGDNLGARESAKNFGRMVRFLLLTAQRRDEAASLRHGHILDGVWRQTDNKSSRPHALVLPPLALSLVGQGGAARDFVFAGSVSKISGFSKLKTALDEASGVEGWRLHDLRRTAASKMQDLGIPNHVVQSVLNHAVPGVGGHYLQAEMEKQKTEALSTWAVALTKIVGPLRVTA